MILKLFTIIYPDGSKKHINSREREQLLLAGEIKHLEQGRYVYNGQVRTYHSFADLAGLKSALHYPTSAIKRYLSGHFVIIEPKTHKRKHELLETPESMALRLQA